MRSSGSSRNNSLSGLLLNRALDAALATKLGQWTHRAILMCFSLFGCIQLGHLRPGFLLTVTAVNGTMRLLFPFYHKQSYTEAFCAVSETQFILFLPTVIQTTWRGGHPIYCWGKNTAPKNPFFKLSAIKCSKCWVWFFWKVEQYLSILSPYLYDLLFSWYARQSLDIFSIWCVMEHFVNFVALQMKVGSAPFYSIPHSLSASGNLILLRTRVPPPRQLTFPLIHSEVPRGVNNCTPVYCHYTTSTDLIQLLKVASENPLTDLGLLAILLLILFTGMLIVVDCVVGNVSG